MFRAFLTAALLLAAASISDASSLRRGAGISRAHVLPVARTLRHADPDLEALLPTILGGVTLTVESQAGTDLSTSSGPFDVFLAGLGKSRADFTLASAYAQGELKAEVGAWRIKDADPALLLPGFKTVMQASSTTPLTNAEETIGGREVTRIGAPGELTQGPLYVVVRGDVLLFVQTPDAALAAEAMQKLPK